MSSDSTAGPVRLERDGPLAVVSFDSPPLNLFDAELEAGLVAALDALETAPVRAVLFRADGRAVSGGVDVSVFDAMAGPSEAEATFARLIALSHRVEALPCPVVFAAHALCLTWAFELALACDILLAAESASFGLVERVIGLTPAMGGTQRLAERAGTARAKEFVPRPRGRRSGHAEDRRRAVRDRGPAGRSRLLPARRSWPRLVRRSLIAAAGLRAAPARSGRFSPQTPADWYVFRLWTGWNDPSAER